MLRRRIDLSHCKSYALGLYLTKSHGPPLRLKIRCPRGRGGSNPPSGTKRGCAWWRSGDSVLAPPAGAGAARSESPACSRVIAWVCSGSFDPGVRRRSEADDLDSTPHQPTLRQFIRKITLKVSTGSMSYRSSSLGDGLVVSTTPRATPEGMTCSLNNALTSSSSLVGRGRRRGPGRTGLRCAGAFPPDPRHARSRRG